MPDSQAADLLRDPVKLVVWDLDDTFWRGTLSEGAVEFVQAHVDAVKTLNRRGIVNAICSKNDAATVERRLVDENDLWDEFVFPRVGWRPKGEVIAQLIEDMQLRPPNVLFIDDNIGNLREAEHYAPGIQTAEPDIIPLLLDLPQLKGKDDSALSRLIQYRQLQTKLSDRETATVSNEDFLAGCAIRVDVETKLGEQTERLLELINRSNQLNFTKRRLSDVELRALFEEAGRQTGYIDVSDKYGAYGIVGFYSLKDGVLTDFVFSCRILHMGVENWLYQRLGSPALTIVGDVATRLDRTSPVTWINNSTAAPATATPIQAMKAKVLLKGGCDLLQVDDFLSGSLQTELSYTNAAGAYVEWHHVEIMRRGDPETIERFGEIIDRLPFLSRAEYQTAALDPQTPVTHVALSLLNEYGQGLYRLRGTDFVVPYGQYYIDITKEEHWTLLAAKGLSSDFLTWFAANFEFVGAVDLARFVDNVGWLASALPEGRSLILINGAEVDFGADDEEGLKLHLHQKRYNDALDALLPSLPTVQLLDMRTLAPGRADVTFNTRHYTRMTFLRIAEALRDLSASDLRIVERGKVTALLHKIARRVRRGGFSDAIRAARRRALA